MSSSTHHFNPASYFHPTTNSAQHTTTANHALLVLNQPISGPNLFDKVWKACIFHIFADGGANRVFDLLGPKLAAEYLPNLIHGDLDSLRDDVRTFYKERRVQISLDPDQYSTDFGKALKKIRKVSFASSSSPPPSQNLSISLPCSGGGESAITKNTPDAKITDVLILGGIAGRVDQGLGLLSEIGREQEEDTSLRLWLVSESSISFILPALCTSIIGPLISPPKVFTRNVGIVPIFGEARIWTKGLEWDVSDWETRMGGMVSSSNHVVEEFIDVLVKGCRVVFTIERVEDE